MLFALNIFLVECSHHWVQFYLSADIQYIMQGISSLHWILITIGVVQWQLQLMVNQGNIASTLCVLLCIEPCWWIYLFCRFGRIFSKRTQRWSHVKVLTPKKYEYIPQLIIKVHITFSAFLMIKKILLVPIMKFHTLTVSTILYGNKTNCKSSLGLWKKGQFWGNN